MIVFMGKAYELDTVLYFCPFAALLLYVLQRRIRKSNKIPYPPGPKADPIIGHARVMPLEYQWYTFADWGKKFGQYSCNDFYLCVILKLCYVQVMCFMYMSSTRL